MSTQTHKPKCLGGLKSSHSCRVEQNKVDCNTESIVTTTPSAIIPAIGQTTSTEEKFEEIKHLKSYLYGSLNSKNKTQKKIKLDYSLFITGTVWFAFATS